MDKPESNVSTGEFDCSAADSPLERDLHRAMRCPLFGPCAELALKGDSVCYRFPESRFVEGAIVSCNTTRLAFAAFGLRTRLHEDFPEYFRRWLYEEHMAKQHRVDWRFDAEASMFGLEADLFIAIGDPLSQTSWNAARDATRSAKEKGALTLLMAPVSFRFRHHVSFSPEYQIEDADCLLSSDTDDPWWSAYEILLMLTSCLRDKETPGIHLEVLRQIFSEGSQAFMTEWGASRKLHNPQSWISANADILKDHDLPAGFRPIGMLLILEELMTKDEIEVAKSSLINAFPDAETIEVIYRPRKDDRSGKSLSGILLYSGELGYEV
ncbi:MAG: hypothetical protein CTY35_03390 [Methylotenera sp.]|jgi:hypothetical protein|uniref:hypothetical protein n=1 Tax=Methylotenera sp. TaxID=2051956 RepID=UPI000D406544|nr:hypothetical protein [Methylotenera sp.]MDP3777560.1 hypothetical protein [Methylotenera sp.]PPD00022.1 MAG: hypothetical protein CTY35_03390 [Methylotenera sp.]